MRKYKSLEYRARALLIESSAMGSVDADSALLKYETEAKRSTYLKASAIETITIKIIARMEKKLFRWSFKKDMDISLSELEATNPINTPVKTRDNKNKTDPVK